MFVSFAFLGQTKNPLEKADFCLSYIFDFSKTFNFVSYIDTIKKRSTKMIEIIKIRRSPDKNSP